MVMMLETAVEAEPRSRLNGVFGDIVSVELALSQLRLVVAPHSP